MSLAGLVPFVNSVPAIFSKIISSLVDCGRNEKHKKAGKQHQHDKSEYERHADGIVNVLGQWHLKKRQSAFARPIHRHDVSVIVKHLVYRARSSTARQIQRNRLCCGVLVEHLNPVVAVTKLTKLEHHRC